jgi:hypothetical protein
VKALKALLNPVLCACLMLGCSGVQVVDNPKPPRISLPAPDSPKELRVLAFMNARVSEIRYGKVRIGELGYYEPAILAQLCTELGAWEASDLLRSRGEHGRRSYGGPDCGPGPNCSGPVSSNDASEVLAIVAIVVGIMLLAMLLQQAEKRDEERSGIRSANIEPAAVAYNRFLIQRLNLAGYSPLIPSAY